MSREILLIHGTRGLPKPARRHWPNSFISYLEGVFGITPKILEWSGNVYVKDRAKAAQDVFNFACALRRLNPETELILIGYSHGGNVAIEAINKLSAETDYPVESITLITIATPIRPIYQLKTSVKLHLNAYNRLDFMQIFGQIGTGTKIKDVGIRRFKGAENREAKRFVGHLYMHSNKKFWQRHIVDFFEEGAKSQ